MSFKAELVLFFSADSNAVAEGLWEGESLPNQVAFLANEVLQQYSCFQSATATYHITGEAHSGYGGEGSTRKRHFLQEETELVA